MEKITTDISTFENLRKDGYTYVDKTGLLWRLVANLEGRQFFISRPRRFGKSLMLSTLAAIFEGKRELFKGLSKTEVDEIGNPKLVLGAPNHEVRGAIRSGWFNAIIKVPATDFDALVDIAKRQVAAGDVDALICETLYRLYAKIPPGWRIRNEADVKRHFRLFMEMLGAKVGAEEGSARGYADAIIETRKAVWVFEFKFNKSANAAVRQIREKGYADAYKGGKRPVTLVGINFRAAKRNIDEPVFSSF